MNLLLALAPTVRRSSPAAFGAERASYTELMPNYATQPPRFFHAFASGGGVLRQEGAAASMRQRGFAVEPIALSAEERAWAVRIFGEDWLRPAPTWLVTCPAGQVTLDENQQRVCGAPKGLERVSEAEAVATGAITTTDMKPAYEWADPRRVKFVYYLPAKGISYTSEEFGKALDAARSWDSMAGTVRTMRPLLDRLGDRVPASIRVRYDRAVRLLAENAEPVAKFKQGFPRHFAAPGSAARARFGVEPISGTLIVWAVIVVAIAGAVMYLSASSAVLSVADAQTSLSADELDKEALRIVADPKATPAAREAAALFLKQHQETRPDPEKKKDPMEQLTDFLTIAAPIAGIGLLAWVAGPALREAGTSAAEQLRYQRHQRGLSRASGAQQRIAPAT